MIKIDLNDKEIEIVDKYISGLTGVKKYKSKINTGLLVTENKKEVFKKAFYDYYHYLIYDNTLKSNIDIIIFKTHNNCHKVFIRSVDNENIDNKKLLTLSFVKKLIDISEG